MSNWYDHRDTDPHLNRQPTNTEKDRMVERGAREAFHGDFDTIHPLMQDIYRDLARNVLRGALGEAEE